MPGPKLLNCYIAKLLKNNKQSFSSNKTIQQSNNSAIRQGFTLIELLIVITIISILASLTLASYSGAQAKSRDGVRKSDLAQMKRAMELAKSDCTGAAYYPYMGTGGVPDYNTLADYLSNSNLKYISSAIKDPKNSAPQQYAYYTESPATGTDVCPDTSGTFTQEGANNYSLAVILERASDRDGVDSRSKCKNKPGPGGSTTDWTASPTYDGYYVICNN